MQGYDKASAERMPARALESALMRRWILLAVATWAGLVVPALAQSPSDVGLRELVLTAAQEQLRTRLGAEAAIQVTSFETTPASAFLVGAVAERRVSAVFDRPRHRLLSVHLDGRALYRWPGPESVAHRGSVHLAPENTLAALEAAIALGASRAEIDVRTTRDGVLVLMHDSTVDRTTNGSGALSEMTAEAVARLDAGSWFGPRFAGELVPTLRSTLEHIRGRIAPDLDLKDAEPAAVVALLRELDMLEGATVFARDWDDVRELVRLAPGLSVRPSIPSAHGLETLTSALDPPIVNIDWRNFSPELVTRIHQQGRLAFVNTLGEGDGRARILAALSAGADFVQSDHTELMTELVQAMKTTPHAGRPLLDAHNAYAYQGRFTDRVDRALSAGLPLAIEQDLCWVEEGASFRSIVSHGEPFTGREPDLEQSFFSKVVPRLEQELVDGNPGQWPVLVLNLDLKHDPEPHLREIERVLARYDRFLTVSERTASIEDVAPLRLGPLLVLTGASDAQQRVFHDGKRVGDTLRLFGAAKTDADGLPEPLDNYRRWWNNPWRKVEGEGQPQAGALSEAERTRLAELVRAAHSRGLWLRFYTLNGHPQEETSESGWFAGYNFGSIDAARARWQAALEAGVDFIATDQYEALAEEMASARAELEAWSL